jgi:hypothetical protein
MYSAAFQPWQEQLKLAMPNQRITAYERYMEWFAFIDQSKHSHHQLLSLEVGELTQLNRTSEMRRVEGVASRTAERTFLCDLNRKRRCSAGQNGRPRL